MDSLVTSGPGVVLAVDKWVETPLLATLFEVTGMNMAEQMAEQMSAIARSVNVLGSMEISIERRKRHWRGPL